MKIADDPLGNFNVSDLRARNDLPSDAFSSESNDFGALCRDLKLADVLSEKIVHAWAGHDKNLAREVVSASSCLVGALDSMQMKALVIKRPSSCPVTNDNLGAFDIVEGCHDILLDNSNMNWTKRPSSCPVTNDNLGAFDIIEKSVRVDGQTILYMPFFQGSPMLKQVSSPINFSLIQTTNLESLSAGTSLREVSQVVCRVPNSLGQGLVCSSTCNIETATDTSFPCYYILLPSDKGLMLLRRLSASEEFLSIPNVSQLISSVAIEEIEDKVQVSLPEVEVRDYDPVLHASCFHKLHMLVKEDLQFGAILPNSKNEIPGSDLDLQNPEVQQSKAAAGKDIAGDEPPRSDTKIGEKRTGPCLTDECEQFIVTKPRGICSRTCISNSKADQLLTSPSEIMRQLHEKNSRILARQIERKAIFAVEILKECDTVSLQLNRLQTEELGLVEQAYDKQHEAQPKQNQLLIQLKGSSLTLHSRIQKFPRLPKLMPCMCSISGVASHIELFFPLSRKSYRLSIDLRDYVIVGQSIPTAGAWLALACLPGRQILLFNGWQTIALRKLPCVLRGNVMVSFVGEPDKLCEVLVVEIGDRFVKSLLYTPVSDRWVKRAIMEDLDGVRDPMAPATTSTHFLWVDVGSGCVFFFENYWITPGRPVLHRVEFGPPILEATMVSSIVREDEFHSFVIMRNGVIGLYTFENPIGDPENSLIPVRLLRGESVFAGSYSSGLFTSFIFDRGQRIYMDLWLGDCVCMNLDGAEQKRVVLKKCHAPASDGLCRCITHIFLLDEQMLMNLYI